MPIDDKLTSKVLIYCAAGGNSGDSYILRSLVTQLREIDNNCYITVACPHAIDLTKFDCDTRVNTFNQLYTFYISWTWVHTAVIDFFHTLRQFRESSIIIVGGGGLINDQFGVSWLSQWLIAPILANLLKKKCMGVGLGVGPIRAPLARKLTHFSMQFFDTITVRDRFSRSELYGVIHEKSKVTLAIDPAFFGRQMNECPRSKAGLTKNRPLLIVPRFDTCSNQMVKKFIAELIDQAGQHTLALAASNKREFLILKDWVDSLQGGISRKVDVYDGSDFSEMIKIIEGASALITMRMHPAIFAFNVGTPLLTVETYDPKLRSISEQVGCKNIQLDLRSLPDITMKAKLCYELAAKSDALAFTDVISNISNGLNKIRKQLASLIAPARTDADR
jgi:polysaccharide pyruvyl transferase WcaK-like protein